VYIRHARPDRSKFLGDGRIIAADVGPRQSCRFARSQVQSSSRRGAWSCLTRSGIESPGLNPDRSGALGAFARRVRSASLQQATATNGGCRLDRKHGPSRAERTLAVCQIAVRVPALTGFHCVAAVPFLVSLLYWSLSPSSCSTYHTDARSWRVCTYRRSRNRARYHSAEVPLSGRSTLFIRPVAALLFAICL
jgi:hypothetical protein